MSNENIEKIKLMLGSNLTDCELDDDTINACYEVAANRYSRGKWRFGGDGALSWIFDYAMANCKLILGEARTKFSIDTTGINGDMLISVALQRMTDLEKELEG